MDSLVKITNLKNEKVNDAAIRFKVMIAGTKLSESTATSNTNGEAIISFQLPDSLKTTDGLLQAIVGTHGVEESISRSIPRSCRPTRWSDLPGPRSHFTAPITGRRA